MFYCKSKLALVTLTVLIAVGLSKPIQAQTHDIEFEIVKAGFIVGVTGGNGRLKFGGKTYELKMGGVSLGATIGASKTQFVGTAENLTKPEDIQGTYTAAQAGLALAGGKKVAELQNARGVILKVKGKQIGLEFSLDLSGLQINLK